MRGVIYEVRNLANGKRYIGLTKFTAQKRWKEHVSAAKRRPKTILHYAILKYGVDGFEVVEVASCLSIEYLGELEKTIIHQEAPEYNQTCGGEVTAGRKYKEETIEVIRSKNTGKKRSNAFREKISEIKSRQYKERPELIQKSSVWLKENRGKWEKKRVEAVRRSATGRRMSAAHKEVLREISRTRVRTPEETARIADAKTKRVECISDGTIYRSRHEAAAAYGVSEKTIWRACNGKSGPVKGLTFSYTGKSQ